MYLIQATRDGKQIPSFMLDENIQGIVSDEQARAIAHEILGNVVGYEVANTAFNREHYADIIGKVYGIPPSYANVREVHSVVLSVQKV